MLGSKDQWKLAIIKEMGPLFIFSKMQGDKICIRKHIDIKSKDTCHEMLKWHYAQLSLYNVSCNCYKVQKIDIYNDE